MPIVRLLGPVDVVGTVGGDAQFGTPRLRCLLAALCSRSGGIAEADWLCEVLWAAEQPAAPESALHNLIFRLRAQLRARGVGEAIEINTRAPGYGLTIERDQVDTLVFADGLARAHAQIVGDPRGALAQLDDIGSLWRGRAYGEFADAPWIRAEVESLEQSRLRSVELAADALIRIGRPAEAAERITRVTAAHPYRESAHRRLIEALWHANRPADALAAYRRLRGRLVRDLGSEPHSEIGDLHGRILAGEPAPGVERVTVTATTSPGTAAGARAPGLIGRRAEVGDIGQALHHARLVTVVGPGGVGKTTVADAYARTRQGTVWRCGLGSVRTGEAVVHSIADSVGMLLRRDADAMSSLTESMSVLSGLLILDNCEHLLPGAGAVAAAVLADCPDIRILATSRIPLGIVGEQVIVLDPLPVPEAGLPASGVAATDAVRLFCLRARSRDSRFTLDESNAEAIAEICRRLDGLPLAVELAATKARAIRPAELVDRLQWRFRILHGAAAEPRHRSLHAVIDWSYDLLGDSGKSLFEMLAVFPGRFALADAEAVADAGGVLPAQDVADAVADLVDSSMVVVEGDGYRMLETLRAYGIEKLTGRGAVAGAQDAHARWVAARLGAAGGDLYGRGHPGAAALVADRFADVRQALDHALAHDVALADRILAGTVPYLELTMSPEVTGWAQRIIGRYAPAALLPGAAPDVDADGVTVGAATFAVAAGGARFAGDLDLAERLAGLGLARNPAPAAAVYLRMMVVEVALFRGDRAGVHRNTAAMVTAAREAGMSGAVHMSELCDILADLYHGDGSGGAGSAALSIAAVCDASGESVIGAWARYVAAECLLDADPPRARTLFTAAIDGAHRTGDRYLLGVALTSRASIEARHGTPAGASGAAGDVSAARAYVDVLTHWWDTGNRTHLWVSMRTVIEVLVGLGRMDAAAILLGAVRGEHGGAPAYGADARRLDEAYQRLCVSLGDLSGLLARGAAMSPADVVTYAVSALAPAESPGEPVEPEEAEVVDR